MGNRENIQDRTSVETGKESREFGFKLPLNSEPVIQGKDLFPFWEGKLINSLDYDRIIRAWPEKVFEQFSSSEKLEDWLAPRVLADVRTGGIFVLSWGLHGVVTGEFIEVVPGKLLRFIWEDSLSCETLVTVEFRGVGIKTHLRLTHQLFGGATKSNWNEGHLNEWIFFLDNLCSVVELGTDLRFDKALEDGWGWLLGSYYRRRRNPALSK